MIFQNFEMNFDIIFGFLLVCSFQLSNHDCVGRCVQKMIEKCIPSCETTRNEEEVKLHYRSCRVKCRVPR